MGCKKNPESSYFCALISMVISSTATMFFSSHWGPIAPKKPTIRFSTLIFGIAQKIPYPFCPPKGDQESDSVAIRNTHRAKP